MYTVQCGDPEGFVPDPIAQFITDSNWILELGQLKMTWFPKEVYILYAARHECVDWLPPAPRSYISHGEILMENPQCFHTVIIFFLSGQFRSTYFSLLAKKSENSARFF
jgi:hypothetical protein